MTNFVSIVIPVYNGSEYLEKTVNSILSQDYTSFELLLVNDGSTDNSKEIIADLINKDSRIKAFHKENGGVAAARNYGIDKAEGDLIAFCDQDDLWLPTKLSQQIPLFENEKVGLVYCGAIAEYTNLNKEIKLNVDNECRGNAFDNLIQVNTITSCTVVARKNLLQQTSAFDDNRELMGVDDWLAWLKLSLVCEFDFIEDHAAIHVFHGENYSSNEEKMHKAELICLSKIEPIANESNKFVDWNEIKQNLHARYADSYIHNSMFTLAGNTLLEASKLKNNRALKYKGWLFILMPNVVWKLMQKMKRTLNIT